MRTFVRAAFLACLVVVPSTVFAQASITGVVKDSSGAVLPGVTVAAASDVLIEKVRSAVTDGTGQYGSSISGPARTPSRSRSRASARSNVRGSS
jgi:hypothetical protein